MVKPKSFKNPAMNFMPDSVKAEEKETAPAAVAAAEPAEPAKPKKAPATPAPNKPTVAPGYEKVTMAMEELKQGKKETKSQRFNFVFQPSLVDAIRRAAKQLDMSANEFCSQVLKRYLIERGFLND